MTLKLDSTGTGANNIGAGLAIQLEDAGGVEEQASLDFQLTDATNASEDTSLLINLNQSGTITEVFNLASTGNLQIDGTFSSHGTTIGLNNDADADSVLGQSAAAGQAGADLYWEMTFFVISQKPTVDGLQQLVREISLMSVTAHQETVTAKPSPGVMEQVETLSGPLMVMAELMEPSPGM